MLLLLHVATAAELLLVLLLGRSAVHCLVTLTAS